MRSAQGQPARRRMRTGARLGIAAMACVAAALALASLVAGGDLLDLRLPGGLPLGNLLAWLVPCGLSAAALALAPVPGRALRFARVSCVFAVAWLPVSLALADDLALNFSGGRGTAWLAFSLAVAACAAAALPTAALAALIRRRRAGAADRRTA
ncbi:hypothetical protein [Coralloluteibacterium stylophorae]|uniref:Uncharacterized protein n=1 Tax=Coralloluteibacterium stylophorae TaxID=1776034 RepID=A0A8J7VU24_9GAMM|nr:hypothetical protein [Coralloluteibacterium stylophorae]MBS7456249.1 hypothetical protein [Coralloluteibacterium stylophorae]